MKQWLFFLFVVSPMLLFGQQEEQLAAQYLSNKEYDKAADIYDRLYNKGNRSMYIYSNLLSCYFQLNKPEEAEQLVKKQQRKFEQNAYYKVDLGYVYEYFNKKDKAEKVYNEIVQRLINSQEVVSETANAFRKRDKIDYALLVYKKARKMSGTDWLYALEMAQLYADKRETDLMLEEYLAALKQDTRMIEDVQGFLQLYLDNDADYNKFKQVLLKKVREFPASELYTEMLVWLYVQRKEFDAALLQVKAIDKRNKERGQRLIQLADLAYANASFDAAIKVYNEVVLLGNDLPYFITAKEGLIKTRAKKLFSIGKFEQADLLALEREYEMYLTEFGRYAFTASAIKELASLRAYYLNKNDAAINNLNELINMPRLDDKFKAECKLELADILILKGEVWDAMLLYGQVDKDYLEDPLGQEAKFRNAKLSYYLGEFEWARAQLDVLKTATTQLIANNAIELSLTIQDNTIDSNEEPLRWFARADLYYFRNRLTESLSTLDSITKAYPKHELIDDIIFKRAQIALKEKNYNQVKTLLEQLVKEHGSGILGDNALFMLADLHETKFSDKEAAKKYYEQFIETYPGSFYLTEVRKRFRALRGDSLAN